ncbi:MAG: fibronectin type III domain-containing protein, partial [Defluviitaleaceae bacterium]|nr:fibronectin type III domain-containing protein [Defluviitaleaceae bacterium]
MGNPFKKIKKITAFVLAFVTAFGVMPLHMIFANPQVQVASVSIMDTTGPLTPLGNPYNVTFGWVYTGPTADTPGTLPGATGTHGAVGFDVLWRNASVPGQPFTWRTDDVGPLIRAAHEPVVVGQQNYAFNWPTKGMQSGSIYAFVAVPYHFHITNIMEDGVVVGQVLEVITPSTDANPQALYLTDITVDLTQGATGGILVEWDNPLFDGTPAFENFRLDFRPEGGTWTNGPMVSQTAATAVGVNRLSFELHHQNLQPGFTYHVRVMPFVGTTPLNQLEASLPASQVAQLPIDGILRPFAFSGREYTNDAETPFRIDPLLFGTPIGLDSLMLNWGMPSVPPFNVERVEVFVMYSDPTEDPDFAPIHNLNARLIHSVSGAGAGNATNFLVESTPYWPPNWPVWFVVRIYVTPMGGGPETYFQTNIVEWDPSFNAFAAYAPTIRNVTHDYPPLGLFIDWLAFTRYHYRESDDLHPPAGMHDGRPVIIDKDVIFHVYITDEIANLGIPQLQPVQSIMAGELIPNMTDNSVAGMIPEWIYTNVGPFTEFMNSSLEMLPLQDNTIYYIRIIAERPSAPITPPPAPTGFRYSQPAYSSYYIPPLDPLLLIPQMVPVRIAEENGVRMVGYDDITIQWNLQWYEAFDTATQRWHDIVGVNAAGDLVFGSAALGGEHVRLWELNPQTMDLAAATAFVVAELGLTGISVAALTLRHMDVSNTDITYEIHVVQYQAMDAVGYSAYFDTINENPALWTDIGRGTPGAVAGTGVPPNHHNHAVTGLDGNTSYVIFFRPVDPRIEDSQRHAWYPMFVSATTLMERPALEIQPTVPIIEVVDVGDTWVELRWNGSFELGYELYYSELLLDWPEGPGRIPITNAMIQAEGREENGFIYFTVHGLFPQTPHHFWIRSFVGEGADLTFSVWSNPVTATTLPIQPPAPPTAISLAQSSSLAAFNVENGTDLTHGDPPSTLILEFGRIFADLNNPTPGPEQLWYEVSGGEATWLQSPSLLATFMAMFEELVPNRRYYVRVRTVLTVTRGAEPGTLYRFYSYIMQVSDTDDFLDAIEIQLPGRIGTEEIPGQLIFALSPWSQTESFFTGMTDEEYDGDVNEDWFPLPDQDFEYIHAFPGILTYRFRSNQIGMDGNRDNQVDQRFISRLVQNRTFNFDIYVGSWGPLPVHTRIVEIPFGIIEAFDQRQINMVINAGNLLLTIPYNSLINAQVRAMPGLDRFTPVFITLSEINAPLTGAGAGLTSTPQHLSVEFGRGFNTVTLDEFSRPVRMQMTMPTDHHPASGSISGYMYTANTGGWQRVASDFTPPMANPALPTIGFPEPHVSFSTWQLGSFSVISTPSALAAPGQLTTGAMQRVNAHLHITDLGIYNELLPIHPNQLNQLLAAVARADASVSVNTPIDQATFQSLGRSGMLVSGDTVTRQAGISSLV